MTLIWFVPLKGQLISECLFGVFKSPKKTMKKRSNPKNKGTLYYFTLLFWFDLVLEARAEILEKFVGFLEI